MTISEQQLTSHSFSSQDAILVTDGIQVEFLKSIANASLNEALLLPLSLHAYATILERGHARVGSHLGFVDFAECKRWYRQGAFEFSRTWLQELGLHFQVEGIDIAELDAPCQFQLFVTAFYINETAERIIHAHPEIETFYVVIAEDRLPLDFYFDSDVPAAVLHFVCERLGRPVRTILMKQRPGYVITGIPRRPAMSGQANPIISDQEMPEIPRSSRPLIGFAPSTVRNYRQIHEAIRKLGDPLLVLPSVWEMWSTLYDHRPESNEYIYRLSAADGEWSTAVSTQLASLRGQFFERRFFSTLPSCIIRNPYLNFQFDYVFARRWLSYANMIRRAACFVAKTPVDLFIHSDHFTPEGAILARLYRRKRTRIVVTLHSGWPVNRNWASWDSSDSAIVPSKTCADQLRQLSGMSDVFITGAAPTCVYRSPIYGAAPKKNKRLVRGSRKIVLLVTNAFEINCFPLTSLKSHFESLSFIGRVLESLKDRVLLVIRTKPGGLGDGPILYRELCGFPLESLTFLDGLDFSQCVSLADCVVGMNLPTSGYFEVLRKGIPLIHVQTADVIALAPDLSQQVVPTITEHQEIWPAIEAVLFDERQRRKVLEIQGRFVAADFKPSVSSRRDPVEAFFRRLLGFRNRPTLSGFLNAIRQPLTRRFGPTHRSAPFDESYLPRCEQGGAGFVDDVLLGSDGSAITVGWAVDTKIGQPAKAIHIFFKGLWVSKGSPWQARSDIAIHFRDKRLEHSGFSVHSTVGGEENISLLSAYAELHDGTFFKLRKAFEIGA
jgi:Glycosyltransferase Family 4